MADIAKKTADNLQRVIDVRNNIRDVLITFGLLTDSAATFDDILAVLQQVRNHGTVSVTLDTVQSQINVDSGYYAGGTVKVVPQEKTATANGEVVADSGKVLSKVIVDVDNSPDLQTKTGIIPTKEKQTINPDAGFDGLRCVEVDAIPDAYQNVSGVTAIAADVRSPKIIVTKDGATVAGTMPDNGSATGTIDGLVIDEYTIPEGYHDGTGKVCLTSAIADALAAL